MQGRHSATEASCVTEYLYVERSPLKSLHRNNANNTDNYNNDGSHNEYKVKANYAYPSAEAASQEGICGSGSTASRIRLYTRVRTVVSLTPRPPCPMGKCTRYSLNRKPDPV